ncbi:MAG: type III polyketide synthase [Alphaproteobacteria bacterium]|nr:type III polyketide synthase [Alphaproteobacteria bacterium]
MTATPRIAAVATAVPPYRLGQTEIAARAAALFGDRVADFARYLPAFANAAIATRHSCVPAEWYGRQHDFAERNDLFIEHATALLAEAADATLARAGLRHADIDMLVVVSTTGVATPSLDARLLEVRPFRRDVERMPIFGLGCAGGVGGLARAARLARSEPGALALLLVVELCGLTFRLADASKSNVIATALFGDGAAGAVLGTGLDGPAIVASGEWTWEESLGVMGWQVGNDGLGVLFSHDIPHLVRTRLRDAAEHTLRRHGLALADIDCHICHPGGAKVLDALEAVYGVASGGMTQARAVLRDHGNMSAATVLFVLEAALAGGLAGRHLMSALGPGFTASFAVLEGA